MKLERFYGCTNGKLDNPELFNEDLKHFEGKQFRMILTNDKKRSNGQNKYWWAVIVKNIADWLRSYGNDVTDEDVHEFLKMKYLGKKEVVINGKTFERYKSTTELTTFEFSELKDKIQRDFAHKGLVLADPNQTEFLDG